MPSLVLCLFFFLQCNLLFSSDISFDELSRCSPAVFENMSPEDKSAYTFYKQVFEENYQQTIISSTLKIPKVIHFIWLGPKSFPLKSIQNVRSWARLHPEWTLKFWTDDPLRPSPIDKMEKHLINELPMEELKDHYEESENSAEKSDILRLIILNQEGGVYVDHDVLCFQPFDTLHYNYDFYCGVEPIHKKLWSNNWLFASNCVVGARSYHPVIKACIENVMRRWKTVPNKTSSWGKTFSLVIERTFTSFSLAVRSHLGKNGNRDIAFPPSFFFSRSIFYNAKEINRLKEQKWVLCNHGFEGTWFTKEKETSKHGTQHGIQMKVHVLSGIFTFIGLLTGFYFFIKLRHKIQNFKIFRNHNK